MVRDEAELLDQAQADAVTVVDPEGRRDSLDQHPASGGRLTG
jgi:hypothetical protein